jgi:hypothetical protein
MSAEITQHRLKTGWLVGVVLAFAIFAVVALYSRRMTNDYPSYDQGRAEQRKATLEKVRHDENALLYPVDDKGNPTATWADQDKGLIKISIDEAMPKEVADLKSKPVAVGAEIPGAAPAAPASTNAAPAVAPASTNAAPAKPAPSVKKSKTKVRAKAPPATGGAPTPSTTSAAPVLTPGVIGQPVFDLRNLKATPATTNFDGFIDYGVVSANPPVFNVHGMVTALEVREGENIVVRGGLIKSDLPQAERATQ